MPKLFQYILVSGHFLRLRQDDVRELSDLLVIPLLVVHQGVECIRRVCVPHTQFDLVFVQGITIEELLVALQADHASPRLVLVVPREGPSLHAARHTVALCAVLAEPGLFGRRDLDATGVAHDTTLLRGLDFHPVLDLAGLVRVSGHSLFEAEDLVRRVENAF